MFLSCECLKWLSVVIFFCFSVFLRMWLLFEVGVVVEV